MKKGTRKTGCPHAKKIRPLPHTINKKQLKLVQRHKYKSKIYKILRRKHKCKFLLPGWGNNFLDKVDATITKNVDKLDFIKI